jgi:hypothetical protein
VLLRADDGDSGQETAEQDAKTETVVYVELV